MGRPLGSKNKPKTQAVPIPRDPEDFRAEVFSMPVHGPELRSEANHDSLRSDMRREDIRQAPTVDFLEEARQRAAEIRGNLNLDDGVDEYYIPPHTVPPGWTYQWKLHSVVNNAELGASRLRRSMDRGWRAVPSKRHPELCNPDQKPGDGPIIRRGSILMEMPTEIVREILQIEQRRATNQVRDQSEKIKQSDQGQFDRDPGNVRLNKSFEPIPIPKDKPSGSIPN